MPVVRVNDATFTDLSALKTWFGTKTPSDTIDRIVREVMDQLDMERDVEPQETVTRTSEAAIEFDTAPSLTFTKLLSASVNGKALNSPRWASLLLATIGHIKAKGIEGEKLTRELHIPARTGRYEDEGFKFHPDLGISVQGQSASDAWKEVGRIADKWRIPVNVEFRWRQNPKAQYPDQTGRLRSGSG
jgi:hypothetical protein